MAGPGLSTEVALRTLWEDIERVAKVKSKEKQKIRVSGWPSGNPLIPHAHAVLLFQYLQTIIAEDSPLHWFSIVTTLLSIICLFYIKHFCSGTILLLILILTLWIVCREFRLKETEIFRKIDYVLGESAGR